MSDLVICELCGKSFWTSGSSEICCGGSGNSKKMTTKDKASLVKKRETAQSHAAKSLKGSVKQKKWAESIREKYLLLCKNKEVLQIYINSSWALNAKFWIENRENSNLEADLITLIYMTKKNK